MMRDAKTNGITLQKIQETAYYSLIKSNKLAEMQIFYFCAWLLQDSQAL